MADDVRELFDGLGAGLYVFGEVQKVWDKPVKQSGDTRFYARFIVEDEPGVIQVNITDLPSGDIRYLAQHLRENALLRVRCFAMEGNAYFKATEFVNGAAVSSGGALAALLAGDGEQA